MAVVMTFIKTTPGIAQYGGLFVENAISPTIGRLYVAKFPQGDSHSMVNEVRNSTSTNVQNTTPKQVLDIVDMANSVNNLSHCYKRQLEMDTLTMTSPTQVFSNIQINGIPVREKQDTGAEISIMPLNIFDRLNNKLKGELKLNPCNDIKVIGYSKQSVKIVGKVTVTCSHAGTTK